MQKKNLFFLKNVVYCVIALFFLGNVAYGGEMKVLAPSSVKIGVPFLIRFKTEATDVQGTLYWCDQKIPLYLAEKTILHKLFFWEQVLKLLCQVEQRFVLKPLWGMV